MALPQAYEGTCVKKRVMPDLTVLVMFRRAGGRGNFKFIVSSGAAADYTVGVDYTFTVTS